MLLITREKGLGAPTEKHHFDYLCDAKHDYQYSRMVWNLFRIEAALFRYTKVYIWADNGLKSKEILFHFSCMAKEETFSLEIHYFAPYHGHSEVDAHFGQAKRALRNSHAGRTLSQARDVGFVFGALPNTIVADVDKPEVLDLRVAPLKGIRNFYSFCLDQHGNIQWSNSVWNKR